MTSFLSNYGLIIKWIGLVSSTCFIVSLIILPWLLYRLEDDYFLHLHDRPQPVFFLRWLCYFLGSTLLIAGVLMLFLPGQGLLTIFLGLNLLDFPGKQKAINSLMAKRSLQKALNWIRQKGNRNNFLFEETLKNQISLCISRPANQITSKTGTPIRVVSKKKFP